MEDMYDKSGQLIQETAGEDEAEQAVTSNLAEVVSVGRESQVLVTRRHEPGVDETGGPRADERLAGDVLRRTCGLAGQEACKAVCQLPDRLNDDKLCSDQNLLEATRQLGIDPQKVLMVGVTADEVGYADQARAYGDKVKQNSVGISEIAGYNAFFARDTDERVLGARLADCGFAAVEMRDSEGETVRGLVHLTRPNMRGETALDEGRGDNNRFMIDDEPVTALEYFMNEAVEHYHADPASIKLRLVAGIQAEHFVHTFADSDGRRPEDRFPGWAAQGMLTDAEGNPPSDPLDATVAYYPQYRAMLQWQAARTAERFGIPAANIVAEDAAMLDPGDPASGHSSNHLAKHHAAMPDSRDAYLLMATPDAAGKWQQIKQDRIALSRRVAREIMADHRWRQAQQPDKSDDLRGGLAPEELPDTAYEFGDG